MTTESPQSKGRDRAISTLDTLIQTLDTAKNACGIPPAQIAIDSTSALLILIRVRSPPVLYYEPPVHGYSGHREQ